MVGAMRLLVLGGTLFLSHAVAQEAVARGHDVTCAARGASGPVPEGARHVLLDRAAPDWTALEDDWDSVVDVGRTPSWVASALDALVDRIPHWVFVSSISVYADHATPGGSQDTLPLLAPVTEDIEQDTPDRYGASKVGCEQLVQSRAGEWLVVRPGLIAGPGDPSGRFGYWPERLAEGGEVLAPESPDRPAQLIDVRDLAAWIVSCAEHRQTGVYDATGHVTGLGDLLDEIARSGRRRCGPGLGRRRVPRRARRTPLVRAPLAPAVAARGRDRPGHPRRERRLRRRPDHPPPRRDSRRHPGLAALEHRRRTHRPDPGGGARRAGGLARARLSGLRFHWVPSDTTTSPPLQREGSGSFTGDPVKLPPTRH